MNQLKALQDQKRKLEEEYFSNEPIYKKIETRIRLALTSLLEEQGIKFLNVSGRVKEFHSFYEKFLEKNYSNPFEDNEDFVGLRVICYFLDDAEEISELIDRNFTVHITEDKTERLQFNEFGYRSIHKIISIPSKWEITPDYRGLAGIKCELQIRTVLMHAWAEVEHKLSYKNKESVPTVISRQFTTISGMFENIDEQFLEMRKKVENYVDQTTTQINNNEKVDEIEINQETLSLYLRPRFQELVKNSAHRASPSAYSEAVAELKKSGYRSISQIDKDLVKDLQRYSKMPLAKSLNEIGWLRKSLSHENHAFKKVRDEVHRARRERASALKKRSGTI